MNSRSKKRMKSAAKVAADTTAGAVGNVVRLGIKSVATVLLVFLTTGLLFTCIFAYYVKTVLSTDLDVSLEEVKLSLSSTIFYKDAAGDYQELVTLHSTENRVWVELDNIPIDMQHAAVAIEDKRFYEHKGVDWYRTVAAFGGMFMSMRNDFGGSTITQQLIKNTTHYDDITVQRKLLEIFRALEFEKTYTKDEIMEWYLNVIYFGEGCYGVGTAAQMYYGKDVWDLSLAECASIVGITNNPSLYSPYISQENNKRRQETILYEMYDQGYITYDQYIQAKNEDIYSGLQRGVDDDYEEPIYTWYVETVINDVLQDLMETKGCDLPTAKLLLYGGGYNIYSSLNMDIQNTIDVIYEDLSQIPKGYDGSGKQLQSAIVVMNPYTGEIMGLSGGVGEKTVRFGTNRATGSKRPPGSSFKPLATYGPAMDLGLITQYTEVNDSPNIVLSGIPWWYPRNAGGGNIGPTNIRNALRLSLNTVSAQILDKLGIETSIDYLENHLGITSLVDGDHAYAPLSLGQLTEGITVREMCQAYCSFVNDGVFTYARTYTLITDANGNVVIDNQPKTIQAWKANTAWNMLDMMKNAVNAGTGTEARLGFMPVAGKTGTTSDSKDRYFVGCTPYYVAAVWTGYDMPSYMGFSGNPAVQLWKKVMGPIHENLEWKDFPTPTIGGNTGIFGDMETASPSPSESESPSPSPSESPSPSPSEIVTTPPVTDPPTEPPIYTDPPTEPPITDTPVTDTPVTDPPTQPPEPDQPVGT